MADTNSKPVIFLAFANDRDDAVGYLRNLPDEARRLRDVLRPAEQAGLCEVVVSTNSTAGDIFKVFQDPKYRNRIAIFHYGGHANGYQLLLESAEGQTAAADAGGLAAFLAQQRGLQLVFLNGCSTQPQTQELLDASISMVISTSRAIDDKVATDFAFQFYQGLAGNAPIRTAYQEAAAAVRMSKGGDPRGLYFGDEGESASQLTADRWPWNLYLREGAESADGWNLPDAANSPLAGLPPLPPLDLPEEPFKHLNWFTREDAEVFFGRGHQIRELYDRLTAPRSAPIVLFYGQSGVGKSSLLAAGLLPRLERDYEVRYVRRGTRGLLETLRSELQPEADAAPLETAWFAQEERMGRPLIVFLDQIEEFYTRPIADMPDELEQLLRVVKATFGDINRRPEGKLVLGFREEWLAKLETRAKEHQLPRSAVHLEPLDRRGIIEAVLGPARSERLRERYALTVEEGLAEMIADDMLADRGSAISTTLQILLSKMWTEAKHAKQPNFSRDLYLDLRGKGILLGDFLDQQLTEFHSRLPAPVDSGLLLDVLARHTTDLGSANECSQERLLEEYVHVGDELPDLLNECKNLYLLTEPTSDQKVSTQSTRLAHDTLAPLVRDKFDKSDKPGQRARRILDNRSVDWQEDQTGTPLDEADLDVVEHGLDGTRTLSPNEHRLLAVSRQLRARLWRNRQILRTVGALAVLVIAVLGAWGWWNFKQAEVATNELGKTNKTLTLSNTELAKKTEEAVSNAREAERQTANASWQVAVNARDRESDPVKAKHNFLLAGCALERAGDLTAYCNARLASDAVLPGLVRSFPHDGPVLGAAFQDDESRILTWSGDGGVKLWDVHKLEPRTHFEHDDGFNIALSKSAVITWTDDGTVTSWSVEVSQPMHSFQHEKRVRGASVTPYDSRVVTWSDDGTVVYWDAATGRNLGAIRHHITDFVPDDSDRSVLGAVLSPKATRMITWGADEAANVWDMQTSRPLKRIFPVGRVGSAAFTRDESRVLIWFNRQVQLWDLLKAKSIDEFEHDRDILGATFNQEETRILSWGADGTAQLRDFLKAETLQTFQHDGAVRGAAFSKDESKVLTWSSDRSVGLWDVMDGERLKTWTHSGEVAGASLSRDEDRLLTWSDEGELKVWDLAERDERRNDPLISADMPTHVFQHHDGVLGAKFNEKESQVLSWSADSTARLWALSGGEPQQTIQSDDLFAGAEIGPKKSLLVTWRDGATLWDMKLGKPLFDLQHDARVRGAMFNRDESRVVTWSEDGTAKLWNTSNAQPLRVFQYGENEAIYGATFNGDESKLLTWSTQSAVLSDAATFKPLQSFAHDNLLGAVLNHDESLICTWSNRDGIARIWEVPSGAIRQTMQHDDVRGAIFNHDGTMLLTWNHNTSKRRHDSKLWDVKTGQQLQAFWHNNIVRGGLFIHVDRHVLTWSGDGTAKLWDVTMKEPLQTFRHNDRLLGIDLSVLGAVLSSDESLVLTWSSDFSKNRGEAKLWNLRTGELVQRFAHNAAVRGAAFSRDESLVLTWGHDGTVTLWDVNKVEPLRKFEHRHRINGAAFSDDESQLVTWSTYGTGALWEVGLSADGLTAGDRVLEFHVRSATRVDAAGQLRTLGFDAWVAQKRQLDNAKAKRVKTASVRD